MIEGTIKTSKYEIIAIFREEQRKQTEIEIFFNNKSISTQIARVDFAEFHIRSESKIPAGNKFKFILHSDSGKIEFTSQRQKNSAGGAENSNKVAFALPECIQVVQRRRDPRFRLRDENDFFCHGRHKNGENCAFDIKDISDGGCALIAPSPNLKFLANNSTLKNAILSLAEYGEITVDLIIKNVAMVTLDSEEKNQENYYQISCQFKFRRSDDRKKIEKTLIDLILEAKRKKRV